VPPQHPKDEPAEESKTDDSADAAAEEDEGEEPVDPKEQLEEGMDERMPLASSQPTSPQFLPAGYLSMCSACAD
jgi:hypothetical protein